MVIHSLATLKKSSKEKEAKIEKELVEVLQKTTDLRKKTGKYRNSHQRCSTKKGVLGNLTKFTGKHLC